MSKEYDFNNLVNIIEALRGENGCPWDKEQTHKSLRNSTLEEAYEVADAIDNNDVKNLKEELGDILLHVLLHSTIAKEENEFTIDEVIQGISKKMIYRHPHIFGDKNVETSDDVMKDWEVLKKKEKGFQTQTEVLKSVPKALPALMRAYDVQKKAQNVGFDFTEIQQVVDKVDEEVQEFKEELIKNSNRIEDELGDILFTLVNLSRKLQINPEIALTKATEKFINRFESVEQSALAQGASLNSMTMEELDSLWTSAKKLEIY